MFYQNQILLEGRLTKKPQVNETLNGKKYSKFSVCFNKPKRLKEPNEEGYNYEFIPNFFNCTAWNLQAEKIAKYDKGESVSLIGELCFDTWEDKNTGEKRTNTYILVKEVRKLMYEKKGENSEPIKKSKAKNNKNEDVEKSDDTYIYTDEFESMDSIPF